MVKIYNTLIDFNSQDDYPHRSAKFWIHEPLVQEIISWCRNSEIDLGCVAEPGMAKRVLITGFAFKTEAGLAMFNLVFYDRIIADQRTTAVYKLHMAVVNLEQKTGKKLF